MVFNQKPRKPIMITANSSKNAQISIYSDLPLVTHNEDQFHHPKISETQTEWILSRDKKKAR